MYVRWEGTLERVGGGSESKPFGVGVKMTDLPNYQEGKKNPSFLEDKGPEEGRGAKDRYRSRKLTRYQKQGTRKRSLKKVVVIRKQRRIFVENAG